MKWNTLSEAGAVLVRQLAESSNARFGRNKRVTKLLHSLGALGEPSGILVILGYFVDDDPGVAQKAASVAADLSRRMPPELLPALDERIRADGYGGYGGWLDNRWWRLTRDALNRISTDPSFHSVLGLATCHGSGFVREAAVVRLDREVSSGAEIPFLLLRLNDWVLPVRRAAEQAIERRLTPFFREAYVHNLALVARLRNQTRAGDSPALGQIEGLLSADLIALVREALASTHRTTLLFGVSLALENLSRVDPHEGEAVLELILATTDPGVRLQATCWLTLATSADKWQSLFLPRLLRDRVVAVRRVALGWCAACQPATHLADLHEALLDLSGKVRSIPQFHLPKLIAMDVRSFYLESLRLREPRTLEATLGGLGETGTLEDAELVLPFIDAAKPRIRKVALKALSRLALERHLETFIIALQADSPGVSRLARVTLEGYASAIGPSRLASISAGASHPHVRLQALLLIEQLPRWQKLPMLIEFSAQADGDFGRLASSFLEKWVANFNRFHQFQPTGAEKLQFRAALAAHLGKLERRIGSELSSIEKVFR
jgi:hypothetical protein